MHGIVGRCYTYWARASSALGYWLWDIFGWDNRLTHSRSATTDPSSLPFAALGSMLLEVNAMSSFRVAVVCALPREADAVTLLLDQFCTYITSRIRGHNVVLAVLPNLGTNSTAAATVALLLYGPLPS
ncbi:hypothetical protein B0I35DRAFT_90446 [Stachybotrys elegans]|uniref:Uncharacterized protein n=1 Tax=Stachybotrys elegans TaxID=80388 RepID=A0A8K0SGX1_9HYPO|nr:hypothetical protein B0I35DRAFT_90446 [Stachybotrys elegans]